MRSVHCPVPGRLFLYLMDVGWDLGVVGVRLAAPGRGGVSTCGGNHVIQEDRATEAGTRASGWTAEEGICCEARGFGAEPPLQDLREQIDIVLPEMTARIAALEHLLLEKQLCARKDLIDARQFVRMQEA